MPPFFRAALLCCILALASCATGRKQAAAPGAPAPRVIGKVALVNEDDRFVLIDSTELPPAGTSLTTLSPAGGETGEVTVSAERRQPFLIGDILRGNPATGDQVLHRPPVEETEKTAVVSEPVLPGR